MPSVSAMKNGHGHELAKIEINVDCGEGYGQWKGGPDEEVGAVEAKLTAVDAHGRCHQLGVWRPCG